MNKWEFYISIWLFCLLTSCKDNINLDGDVVVSLTSPHLSISGNSIYRIDYKSTILDVPVDCSINYIVLIPKYSQGWITLNSTSFKNHQNYYNKDRFVNLKIAENTSRESRTAQVVISNETYSLSDTLTVIQAGNPNPTEYYVDGSYIQIKQATKGDGVNLFLMGDGFTKEYLAVGGRYEEYMKQAADYFFSIEPYNSYQEYFNVYAIMAESEGEGIKGENGNRVSTKFQCEYGSGTAITCNDDICFEYAQKVKEAGTEPMTLIVVLNSEKYAGTTYLYSDGNSIALCPMSREARPNDFEGVVHHEAGGHGFGFLCDEYVYYQREMPESRKEDIRAWQALGFQMNLDFTDNLTEILWKDFIGIDKYKDVGAFEGGYEYRYGVWRPEENSCMNNNIPYFNVQSRRAIVQRIMNLGGEQFVLDNFIANDNVSLPEEDISRVAHQPISLLGTPVWNWCKQ